MRLCKSLLAFGVAALLTASAVQADMISTVFGANNGGAFGGAVYFDVNVGANPITVTGLETNTDRNRGV